MGPEGAVLQWTGLPLSPEEVGSWGGGGGSMKPVRVRASQRARHSKMAWLVTNKT